uniref:RanBD1 domain-containing protein n=1 Tax=Arcella intermedia TaxID=1963864 RepID=A0A6B2LDY7_9EUKA
MKLGETISFPTFSVGTDQAKTEPKEGALPSLDIPATDFSSFSATSETTKNLTQVETHTGEEGEKVEVEVRVKLFEFVKVGESSSWKERGAGPLRILVNPTTSRYRLVMRTDNAIRVVLNALPYADMRIEKPHEKQIRFTCINAVESSSKIGSFWIKLMNGPDTNTLFRALEKVKAHSKIHSEGKEEAKEDAKEAKEGAKEPKTTEVKT